jgi:hypothetical protein
VTWNCSSTRTPTTTEEAACALPDICARVSLGNTSTGTALTVMSPSLSESI